MQKCFLNAFVVLFLFILSGCQSGAGPMHQGSFFISPFTQNFHEVPQNSLTQSVQEALLRSDDPAIAQVQVNARADVVVLTGYVKKIRQSDTAELIARQVPGVRAVENRIIIRP